MCQKTWEHKKKKEKTDVNYRTVFLDLFELAAK